MLHLDSWEELAEALVLLADLEGELPGVAHDQHRHLGERDIVISNTSVKTREFTCPSTGSICWSVASTNTAVLPMPDLAWDRMSIPSTAWHEDRLLAPLHEK